MKLKILVVDDAPGIREILEVSLSEDHHRVMTACSGEQGLGIVKKNPDLDLVITDRNMSGGMLGEEMIRKIKLLNPRVKTVLMSSEMPEEMVLVARAAGADRFVSKEFLFTEINAALRNLFPLLIPP